MLGELWGRASATQPPLSWETSLLFGRVALLVTWSPVGHRLVRHLVTLVHEAGHAAVAGLLGRRLSGIRLHSDTSGVTVSRGRPRGPGMVATLLAGYPAPALVGLVGAYLLGAGYAAAVLWALVLTCALVLLLVRNLYGLWVVLVLGVGVALLSWTAPAAVLSGTAYLVVWALLLAAPRAVVDLHRERRRGRRGGSDAEQLRRLTGLPAWLWTAAFGLVTVGALVAGARELVPVS
ncbi:M50 family metallopeptidase [Ornithinimicrobium sufpigmenti]|uniref:M50 family metallopeptidase n=1 Tax=Ornithinimicrobium sufpigmenti TaxID=2508882 RepID=UPI001035BCAC|nr:MULTISPECIES: M50 family metallopeptidase [unclassified Ornithinimicrobium]